jgi:hypothetical protein
MLLDPNPLSQYGFGQPNRCGSMRIHNTGSFVINNKHFFCGRFEERQLLRFAVYDIDGASPNLEHHDFLGAVDCALGQRTGVPDP